MPRLLPLTALITVAALAAACGGAPTAEVGVPAPEASASSETATFLVSVPNAFGTTVVPAEPKRIVVAGATEQDVVMALGTIPVGVTEWYGNQPYATWPWAQDELGDAKPTVLSMADGFQYEKIASLDPDLIVAVNAGTKQDSYDKLTAIAPTIAQPKGATEWFSPWDGQTIQIGKAMGKQRQAEELVAKIKKGFADAAAAHPEFKGLPAIFLQAPYYEGKAIAYQDGLSTAFLTDLGFTVPKEIAEYAPPQENTQAFIPTEKLSVLNSGKVLVWATEDVQARKELEKQPLYRQLTPVKQGNLVFTDAELAGAIYFTTPLSLPYVLDKLIPLLDKAVDGNPETVPSVS